MMANCTEKEKYLSKDRRCCDRCPAGTFIKEDCNGTNRTKCSPCPVGSYTEHLNHVKSCLPCEFCITNSDKVSPCTAEKNTVCQCKEGFFCGAEKCDHCEPWKQCSEGNGVKVQPTPTRNTVCSPCEDGTYSNVTDYSSPCKPHNRCEEYGLQLKTPGTATTNAICQPCESRRSTDFSWILPAGLWAGLVLTIVLVAAFLIWRARRRSYRAGKPSSPITMVIVPEPILAPPELLSHCQESCNDCKLPPFTSDDPSIIHSMSDSLDSSPPITLLKPSVSFAETNQSSSIRDPSGNFFRLYSEPQEDEWCGT